MTARRLTPIVLVALAACAGCAVRMASTPAAVAPKPAPHSAPSQPSGQPAAVEPPVVTSGTGGDRAVAAPVSAAPAPVASHPAPAGEAPPATASAFVFSPRQAVAAPPLPQPSAVTQSAEKTPAASDPKPGAPGQPAPPSHGELQLVVVASAPEIAEGGIVTVDVMASSDTAVVDAPLHLSFDPNVMAFVDGAPGDFLAQGGSSIVFFADGSSRPGDVAVAAGRVERSQGARGAGLLCRVRLKGIGAGATPVIVAQAKAWDVGGAELTVQAGGTTAVVR
jgi:hypothetical protein